jgi:hypothetical protein
MLEVDEDSRLGKEIAAREFGTGRGTRRPKTRGGDVRDGGRALARWGFSVTRFRTSRGGQGIAPQPQVLDARTYMGFGEDAHSFDGAPLESGETDRQPSRRTSVSLSDCD